MATIQVPTRDQVDEKAQVIFDNLKSKLGMVPNLFAYIGHSGNALESYLGFQTAQAKGTFRTNKEREAVYLAVSQVNECCYCQSAHSVLGKMAGLSDDEMLEIRQGRHSDPKLNAVVSLAQAIQKTHGRPDRAVLENFFNQGYDQRALVDLVALVADKVFANYVHNLTQIEIDFPLAPALEKASV